MALPPDIQAAHAAAETALRRHTSRSTWLVAGVAGAGLLAGAGWAESWYKQAWISMPTAAALALLAAAAAAAIAAVIRYVMRLQDCEEALEGVVKRHREYDALIYQYEAEQQEALRVIHALKTEVGVYASFVALHRLVRRTGDDE